MQHFSGMSVLCEAGSVNMPILQGARLSHILQGRSPQRLTHRWQSRGCGVHTLSWRALVCACVSSHNIIIQSMQCGRPGFYPWVGKIPCRREQLPTQAFWPGECHGLYSPWVAKSGTRLSDLHFHALRLARPDPARLTGGLLLPQFSELSSAAPCDKMTPW